MVHRYPVFGTPGIARLGRLVGGSRTALPGRLFSLALFNKSPVAHLNFPTVPIGVLGSPVRKAKSSKGLDYFLVAASGL
jgi:hypothetical protein